jgi:hypothetical protein
MLQIEAFFILEGFYDIAINENICDFSFSCKNSADWGRIRKEAKRERITLWLILGTGRGTIP